MTNGDERGQQAIQDGQGQARQAGPLCPNCAAVVPVGSRFCVKCGTSMEAVNVSAQATPAPAATTVVCPKCGASVEQGNRFCTSCGWDMQADGAQAATVQAATSQTGISQDALGGRESAPKKKSRAWIPICFILFAALGVGAYVLLQNPGGLDDLVALLPFSTNQREATAGGDQEGRVEDDEGRGAGSSGDTSSTEQTQENQGTAQGQSGTQVWRADDAPGGDDRSSAIVDTPPIVDDPPTPPLDEPVQPPPYDFSIERVVQDMSIVLKDYYIAYLDAINDQDSSYLKNVTDGQAQRLRERLADSVNQTDFFRFSHIIVDLDTVNLNEYSEIRVSFTASFHFNYQDRQTRGEWKDLFNVQKVEMIFDWNGQNWLVDYGELIHPDPLGPNQWVVR